MSAAFVECNHVNYVNLLSAAAEARQQGYMYLAQQLETVSTCKPNNVSVQDKHIHKRYDSESITISNYTQIHDDIPLYYWAHSRHDGSSIAASRSRVGPIETPPCVDISSV